MDPKKKILDQRSAEVTKAGRMFFNAIFGETEKFVREVGEEGDREAAEREAITVDGEASEDEDDGREK